MVEHFDELTDARELLDRRYDELESGRVQPIDGEEAYRRLIENTAEQRLIKKRQHSVEIERGRE